MGDMYKSNIEFALVVKVYVRMTVMLADGIKHPKKKRPFSWKNLIQTAQLVGYGILLLCNVPCREKAKNCFAQLRIFCAR